jgi:predicted MFS family arabinose efflux permease
MGFRASVVQLGYVLGGLAGGGLLALGGYALMALIFGLLIVIASVFMSVSVDTEDAPSPRAKPG